MELWIKSTAGETHGERVLLFFMVGFGEDNGKGGATGGEERFQGVAGNGPFGIRDVDPGVSEICGK